MRVLKVGMTPKWGDELFHVFDRTRTGDHCIRFLATGRTATLSEAKAQELVGRGKIKGTTKRRDRIDQPIELEQDLSSFPKKDLDQAFRCQAFCDAILRHGKPSPISRTWPPIIEAVRVELAISEAPHWKTVNKWLRTYVKHGCDVRSLIPRHSRKGRRPLDIEEPLPQNRLITDAIDYWLDGETDSGEQPTMRDAHKFLEDKFNDAAEEFLHAVSWKAPCYETFCRMIDGIPEYERVRRRDGERAAEKQFEHGGPGRHARYPLEVVEIDDTWDEHILCSDDDRRIPLGRPYLTVAFDKATAMPVGMHISFDPPSAETALECLRNAVLPKKWLIEEFPHIGPWDAFGVPREVMVDNGSNYRSDQFRDGCARIGSILRVAPAYKPEFKGSVERVLRTIKQQLRLPGVAGSNPDKNGNPKPEGTAYVTLAEYREAVLNYLINEYAQNWHRGIAGVPTHRWAELTKDFTPELPDDIDLAGAFGLLESATLSKTGLVYESNRYYSTYLKKLHHQLGNVEVWFRVLTRNLRVIHVIDPDTQKLVAVKAVDGEYTADLSLYEHKQIRKMMLEEKRNWEKSDARRKARKRYRANLEDILSRGKIRDKKRAARVLSPGFTTPTKPEPATAVAPEAPSHRPEILDEDVSPSDDDPSDLPPGNDELIDLPVLE